MSDEYVYCPECGNDYKLQMLGNYANGTEYVCPECLTSFIREAIEALKESDK